MIPQFSLRDAGCSDQVVTVSDKDENEEVARLERLNDDLKRSLRRCRDMLHDYAARLTANSNGPSSRADAQERRKS